MSSFCQLVHVAGDALKPNSRPVAVPYRRKKIRRFADLEAACSIIAITYLLTDGAVDTDELCREIKRKNPGLWPCLEQAPHIYATACRDAVHLCSLLDHPPSVETTVSD